eukprot:m.17507 g.17507  ORF g.17507 m.17507 type:complete len:215 (-) comp4793_c2_seq1:207-851(-)
MIGLEKMFNAHNHNDDDNNTSVWEVEATNKALSKASSLLKKSSPLRINLALSLESDCERGSKSLSASRSSSPSILLRRRTNKEKQSSLSLSSPVSPLSLSVSLDSGFDSQEDLRKESWNDSAIDDLFLAGMKMDMDEAAKLFDPFRRKSFATLNGENAMQDENKDESVVQDHDHSCSSNNNNNSSSGGGGSKAERHDITQEVEQENNASFACFV